MIIKLIRIIHFQTKTLHILLDISNSQNVLDALEIDAATGIISVKKSTSFDFEEFVNENGISKVSAIIRATDSNGNYDKATILFEILNVDELPIVVSDTQISLL